MALFDGEPLSVSLQAVEETFVIAISRDSFLRFVGNNPAVAGRIASTIGKRFKDAQDRMVDMARGAVENRVKNALRLAHSQFGVVLPLTHQEIADMIGISRESATRVLGRLHQTGVIRIKRGGIVIVNEGELNI